MSFDIEEGSTLTGQHDEFWTESAGRARPHAYCGVHTRRRALVRSPYTTHSIRNFANHRRELRACSSSVAGYARTDERTRRGAAGPCRSLSRSEAPLSVINGASAVCWLTMDLESFRCVGVVGDFTRRGAAPENAFFRGAHLVCVHLANLWRAPATTLPNYTSTICTSTDARQASSIANCLLVFFFSRWVTPLVSARVRAMPSAEGSSNGA